MIVSTVQPKCHIIMNFMCATVAGRRKRSAAPLPWKQLHWSTSTSFVEKTEQCKRSLTSSVLQVESEKVTTSQQCIPASNHTRLLSDLWPLPPWQCGSYFPYIEHMGLGLGIHGNQECGVVGSRCSVVLEKNKLKVRLRGSNNGARWHQHERQRPANTTQQAVKMEDKRDGPNQKEMKRQEAVGWRWRCLQWPVLHVSLLCPQVHGQGALGPPTTKLPSCLNACADMCWLTLPSPPLPSPPLTCGGSRGDARGLREN